MGEGDDGVWSPEGFRQFSTKPSVGDRPAVGEEFEESDDGGLRGAIDGNSINNLERSGGASGPTPFAVGLDDPVRGVGSLNGPNGSVGPVFFSNNNSPSKQIPKETNSSSIPSQGTRSTSVGGSIRLNGTSKTSVIKKKRLPAESSKIKLGGMGPLGKGRMSYHLIKQMARSSAKKKIGTKQTKRKGRIQETKLGKWSKEMVGNVWGWDNGEFVQVPAEGNSGGLVLIWDPSCFKCDFFIAEKNFLVVIGGWTGINGLVGFINVYGPREQKERLLTWQKVEDLCTRQDVKWCVFGDFNEVRGDHEILNTITNLRGAEDFNSFIGNCDLIEVPLGNRRFTRVSDDGRKFSKLDRFLISRNFGDVWKGLGTIALDRRWSDHYPIMLSDSSKNFGPKPIKVFDTWLDGKEAEDLVRDVWSKECLAFKPDRIKDKLKNVRLALHEKNRGGANACQAEIDQFKAEMKALEEAAEVRNFNDVERSNWMAAREKWLKAEKRNFDMLRQKAKLKWFVEGDENSKIFHAAIRKRNRTNGLKGVNINAEWIEEPSRIKNEVMGFFKKQFSSQKVRGATLISEKFKKLREDEAADLEKPFSEEEVLEAIKGCGNNKAPGPDGTSIKFVRKFWDVIKGDFLEAIGYFWENKEISEGCNASFVTLIPKVANPIGLNEYRPISLVGIYYKIISKLLTERLKKVIGKLIGDKQSAFIQGRFILDGVLIANEVVEDLRKAKKKGMIFKVDFEKAYDSVEWDFLLDIMKTMGFGEKWRKWVEVCLKSASISILVNGAPTKEFKMTRGIRQGNPLAPFLFLLIAEGLHILMLEAREKGLFDGVRVGKDGVEVSHLQYADDAVFFGGWSHENLKKPNVDPQML
ncbi:hypothetical protein OSB04_023255 [Centaurea solstitialis]|uniref:Reverse transcriptase domain-containing protein n=1 Tax=Centaurea solstitialis TaxID=347529 RepID=A0AA38T3H5_9ASTR|nr:hypothetical protein OSB04_023255 [Centaurea solstitialis]